MPISAQCDHCQAKLRVRDELAGKRVKCPKCSQTMSIPGRSGSGNPSSATAPSGGARRIPKAKTTGSRQPATNPMLDLLDEAGVEAAPRGRVCNNCGADLSPLAIICVECGFNNETGKQLETTTYKDPRDAASGMSEAEKMLAKAEQEIDDMPVSSHEQNFGDGAESILIAAVALIVMLVLAGIGVGTIFVMDRIGENINTAWISFYGALGIYAFCVIWITSIAFRAKPIHGLACVFSAGLYCIVFGFMQGKSLLLPTLICCFGILIGLLSWVFASNDLAMMLDACRIPTIV